jgi:hypothetical protein
MDVDNVRRLLQFADHVGYMDVDNVRRLLHVDHEAQHRTRALA